MNREPDQNSADSLGRACRTTLRASEITVTRLRYDRDDLPPTPPSEQHDAFSVIMQLKDFRMHRLWKGGVLLHEGGYTQGTLAITDMREQWRCQHLSPFDNIRFHIPFSFLRSSLAELGQPMFSGFECRAGARDEVILGLSQALLPALANPRQASQLFLEQMGLAVLTHLYQAYGGHQAPIIKKGVLAPWQQKRATEFLAAHVDAQISIGDLAETCALSRSYFNKAFKETFGKTPYRWLIEYRVARAKDLLMSDASIAEIAVSCGFADQSHMTRTFSDITGEPPGYWRRQNRFA